MADGHKVVRKLNAKSSFGASGATFFIMIREIKLGCYDMIMEVDWMKRFNLVSFDFIRNEGIC